MVLDGALRDQFWLGLCPTRCEMHTWDVVSFGQGWLGSCSGSLCFLTCLVVVTLSFWKDSQACKTSEAGVPRIRASLMDVMSF